MERSIRRVILGVFIIAATSAGAQQKALVNTIKSPYSRQYPVDVDAVQWTGGFWGRWFQVSKDTMAVNMLRLYQNDSLCHGFRNFEIAAGLEQGNHRGAPFHDGDFYKTLEAVISVYALTRDQQLYNELEQIIGVIAAAQRSDGYIHTPTTINYRNNPGSAKEFEDRMNFETYNMGHLMTAACLHYRVTGQKNFLDIAVKAADFLVAYHENATAEQARNAICPSHYMGVVEMYRSTGNEDYLNLAKKMIDIRGLIDDGTDHNQDRIPFRQQKEAVGHAVRANYLYAGVADIYLETGEDSLMTALERIWHDVVDKKLYVTGACGALYDGISPQGTTYNQPYIQQVHQAYGQAYQLPNITAHNETCANIGNVLWNYRMLLATADPRYADVLELTLYNSVLSGTDLGGTKFNYTNPLRIDHTLPFELRWSKEREPYISKSNCCPPNVVRTIAESHNYAYSLTKTGLSVNLFGSNMLNTKTIDGEPLKLRQETDYPWDGTIRLTLEEAPTREFGLNIRIPSWADQQNTLSVNGIQQQNIELGKYASISRKWMKGDVVELTLTMTPRLIQSNRLIEATRNQVAIKRGPIIYCLESPDLLEYSIFDVTIPLDIELKPVEIQIAGASMMALEGQAMIESKTHSTPGLYFPIDDNSGLRDLDIRLIPYHAWGNRGSSEMSVWIPVRK